MQRNGKDTKYKLQKLKRSYFPNLMKVWTSAQGHYFRSEMEGLQQEKKKKTSNVIINSILFLQDAF